MTVERPPTSIKEQARFIESLVARCFMRDGTPATETVLMLSKDEAADLAAIGARMERMAPHEETIRRAVTGR